MNLGNDNFNLVTGADLENGEIDFGNGAKFRDSLNLVPILKFSAVP